jgi:hypothetical protein
MLFVKGVLLFEKGRVLLFEKGVLLFEKGVVLFFINTDYPILKFSIYRNIDISRYSRYYVYVCIFKRHIKLFQALIGVISEGQRRSMC